MTRTVTAALALMLTVAVLPAAADDTGIVVTGTPLAPVPARVGQAEVTVATIVAAERMWKNNNKMGAIAVLIASNSVAALVAARNARTLGQLR